MLVPGMYTTIMPHGERRHVVIPLKNQPIHDLLYNHDKVYHYGHSRLIILAIEI